MMVRIPYITAAGERRVYEYPPPERPFAVDRCRRSLCHSGELIRIGKARWRAGPTGRRFNDSTVRQLIARGAAVMCGETVRLV
jgi:hypothetical protein